MKPFPSGWPNSPFVCVALRVDQHPKPRCSVDRLFSHCPALLGTLTIRDVLLDGGCLGPRGIAAAILTVAPFHIRFAQETRMYTLLTLNASLALFFLARLLTDPRAATDRLGAQLMLWFGSWRAARRVEAARTRDATGEPDTLGYAKDVSEDAGWASRPIADRRLPLSSAATDLSWLGLIFFTVAAVLSHNTAVLFPLSTNLLVLGFILWRRRAGTQSKAVPTPYPAQLAPPSLRNWSTHRSALLLWRVPWPRRSSSGDRVIGVLDSK
jgi:hypothetical protein